MLINKLTTAFGDHSSLLPLFAKDVVNSAGMTAFSYDAGGKIEAKDRCLDEFGTMALWMGGLPFFKWLYNNSAYKLAKINPDVDYRLLTDKAQLSVAQRYSESLKGRADIAQSIAKAAANTTKSKALFLGKFASATALTLASFFTLVKLKQHYTKKQIEKQFWAKKSAQMEYSKSLAQSPAFKAFLPADQTDSKTVKNSNVSFKGLGSIASKLKGAMFDPVQNLFLVDVGISGERLVNSRTKTEFAETSIKEGSLLFFLYVAGKFIQDGIEKISEKFGKPIGLHAEVLSSAYMDSAIKSGKVHADVNALKQLIDSVNQAQEILKTDKSAANKLALEERKKALFEFIYNEKNQDNTVIKAAKQSKIIKTIVDGSWMDNLFNKAKKTNLIDPMQYIKIGDIESVTNNVSKLAKFASKHDNITEFLKKCRNMKIASVAANMGISCLCLGLIVPYAMMKYREKQQNGNKEFHVQSEIERQLEQSFKGRMA